MVLYRSPWRFATFHRSCSYTFLHFLSLSWIFELYLFFLNVLVASLITNLHSLFHTKTVHNEGAFSTHILHHVRKHANADNLFRHRYENMTSPFVVASLLARAGLKKVYFLSNCIFRNRSYGKIYCCCAKTEQTWTCKKICVATETLQLQA